MKIKRFTALCAIFALCFNSSNRVSGEDNLSHLEMITEESEEIAYQKLLKMEKEMKDSIKKMIDQALPMLMNQKSPAELSGPCMGSIFKMVGALAKMKLWPFEMLDAFGIPGGGIFSGTLSSLGSYKQCTNIVIPSYGEISKPNVGKYCIVELGLPLPPKPKRLLVDSVVFRNINATFESEIMQYTARQLPFSYTGKYPWGVCVPSACTIDDLNQLFSFVSKKTGFNVAVRNCEIKEPFKMDKVQIAIVSTLFVFIVVNILSTIVHEVQLYRNKVNQIKNSKDFWITAISYFSIRQNFVNLMKTTKATKRSLDAINGIRFITMAWVVLGHGYVYIDPRVMRELRFFLEYPKDFAFQVIANCHISVSTFFFLTALLRAYNDAKHNDVGKPRNQLILFVRRCYRLTPVMLLVIGIAILGPLVGSGPIIKEAATFQANVCKEYWWRNALFIHNFFNFENMCLGHTWFLSVDIQCYIVALIYLFILFKNKTTAKLFLILAMLGSWAGTAYVTYVNDFPPSYILRSVDEELILDYLRKVHLSAYQYISLYCAGLFLGTYMARASKIHINKYISITCWIVSFALGLTIVYAVHPWNSGEPYTMLEAISYASLNRLAWGIALGWVIWACFTGRGGIINTFLSWPGFQPLVKLSFIVYMIHPLVYQMFVSKQQGSSDSTHISIVFRYLACLVISHIIAIFIRVMYECPLHKIEEDFCKWLLSRQVAKVKSANLHNGIDLSSEMKNSTLKVNKSLSTA